MRFRTRSAVATLTLALLTGLAGTLAVPATADERPGRLPDARPGVVPELPAQASPTALLAVTERVVSGDARAGDPEPTIALRDLRRVLTELDGAARARAEALLSNEVRTSTRQRTSHRAKLCGDHVCVHYNTNERSDDFTTRAWAKGTRRVLEDVWAKQVGKLGYRRPRRDGDTGGRLDVYLRDIGGDGIYGWAAPTNGRRVAPGELTLDNDYSRTQYPSGTPESNLKVTAAHEFFHAVQFGYDSWEDAWLMEATATWMEERVFDAIDDNRQYLPASQLQQPARSLDLFSPNQSLNYYGNWIWFEYLTTRFGRGIVKKVWNRVGDAGDMPNDYSIEALRKVLRGKGGFRDVYAGFAGANTHPASTYPEGSAPGYGRPGPAKKATLSAADPRWSGTFRVNHQASKTVRAEPAASLGAARLRVRVDGPGRRTAPALAVTVVRLDGTVSRRLVRLGREGRGATTVAFGSGQVQDVSVTAVNASTRYKWCKQGDGTYACYGYPRDQKKRFEVALRVRR